MSQEIYDEMWKKFTLAAKTNSFELDPYLLNLNADTRRGLSIIAYLKQANSQVLNKITDFQEAIRKLEPAQYYHPFDELHLTILPVVSCLADFRFSSIEPKPYIDIFQNLLQEAKPIEIHYQGITASANCIVLQGFATDNSLDELRQSFRQKLRQAKIKTNIDSRYKLTTAHSSTIRFCSALQNPKTLFELCQRYRDHDFGKIRLSEVDLVFNNWYQQLSITKVLSHYAFAPIKK